MDKTETLRIKYIHLLSHQNNMWLYDKNIHIYHDKQASNNLHS